MKTCSFDGLSNFNRRGISQDQVNKKRTLLFFRSFLRHLLLLFLSFTAVTMFYLKHVSLNNTEKSRVSFLVNLSHLFFSYLKGAKTS